MTLLCHAVLELMAKLATKQPSTRNTLEERERSSSLHHLHHLHHLRAKRFTRTNKQLPLCFRPLLKQIKNSAESHIVLDCSTERIYDVLKQAQQIGMMSDYHSYLITSLVSSLIKWECNEWPILSTLYPCQNQLPTDSVEIGTLSCRARVLCV